MIDIDWVWNHIVLPSGEHFLWDYEPMSGVEANAMVEPLKLRPGHYVLGTTTYAEYISWLEESSIQYHFAEVSLIVQAPSLHERYLTRMTGIVLSNENDVALFLLRWR